MRSSGLTEMLSVRKQAASNTRSSLAPAASTLGSPVGSGNPNSDIFSSTVCPEAMKSLLSKLRCVTSVFEQRQSQCQSSHTLRNSQVQRNEADHRGSVSGKCCVFEMLMP